MMLNCDNCNFYDKDLDENYFCKFWDTDVPKENCFLCDLKNKEKNDENKKS